MIKVDNKDSSIIYSMEKMHQAYSAIYDDYLSPEEEQRLLDKVRVHKNEKKVIIQEETKNEAGS